MHCDSKFLNGTDTTVGQPGEWHGRAERSEAAKELLDNFAHEFNNSLAQVAGYLTLAQEEFKDEPRGALYLSKVADGVERIQKLLQEILDATHPERNSAPSPTNLAGIIKAESESWAQGLPKGAQISLELGLVPCTVCVDERLWRKVIRSLLANAQRALEGVKGGDVRVQLRPLAAEAGGEAEGQRRWELLVEDTGCGMSEEVLKRACDPLFTTRSHGKASGLGLTLVHNAVQLQGGELFIESVPSEGTHVRIILPESNGCL